MFLRAQPSGCRPAAIGSPQSSTSALTYSARVIKGPASPISRSRHFARTTPEREKALAILAARRKSATRRKSREISTYEKHAANPHRINTYENALLQALQNQYLQKRTWEGVPDYCYPTTRRLRTALFSARNRQSRAGTPKPLSASRGCDIGSALLLFGRHM
jgi:hypothetical protein